MWEADLKLWELIAIKLHGMCLMPSWRSGLPNLSESLFQVSDIVLAWLRVESSHVVKVMLLSPEMTSLPNCLLGMCTQLNAETSSINWSGQVSAPCCTQVPPTTQPSTPQGSSSIHHFWSWFFVKLESHLTGLLPPTVKSSPSSTVHHHLLDIRTCSLPCHYYSSSAKSIS